MTFDALVAKVRARLVGKMSIGEQLDERRAHEFVFVTLDELGLKVDEASGEIVAKEPTPAFRPLESNLRNSIHVPARRRR